MAHLDEFTWILVLGIIFSFGMAFGIGANDVANAFGSSVAARSLTLAQAIVIASTFEFLGAVAIGQSVTGTIRNKIVDQDFYEDRPDLLMFGMLSALVMATTWLMTATYLEFPVSTTHDIIGAIIGFSLAAFGVDSVDWKSVGKVVASWIAAPLFTGTIAFIFYTPIRMFVMEAENSFSRAVHVYPIVVFVGIAVNAFFVLFKMKDVEKKYGDEYGMQVVLPTALGGGALVAICTYIFIVPHLKNKVEMYVTEKEERKREQEALEAEGQGGKYDEVDSEEDIIEIDVDTMIEKKIEGKHQGSERVEKKSTGTAFENQAVLHDPVSAERTRNTSSLHMAWDYFADNTFRQDLKTMSLEENKGAKMIWENSTMYDERTERLFSYLQVFTACLTSFAHGGNDVANAIAPLSAILSIWKEGVLESKSDVPKWILAMGGAGLACGFTLFGYKIIKAVGYKLTCITPSRGFCIELATAMAVSSASFMELPVSSTQCLVGATAGVGLAHGGVKQVQWKYLARTMCGWVIMFWVVIAFNAGFFAYSIYSPNIVDDYHPPTDAPTPAGEL